MHLRGYSCTKDRVSIFWIRHIHLSLLVHSGAFTPHLFNINYTKVNFNMVYHIHLNPRLVGPIFISQNRYRVLSALRGFKRSSIPYSIFPVHSYNCSYPFFTMWIRSSQHALPLSHLNISSSSSYFAATTEKYFEYKYIFSTSSHVLHQSNWSFVWYEQRCRAKPHLRNYFKKQQA